MDGLCLGLKRAGKSPLVVLNSRKSEQRQRFTLAHELGHVLIPWHIGDIFDTTARDEYDEQSDYWRTEAEANRFASELLMPSDWVRSLISSPIDPPVLVELISKTAKTSRQSAVYKLASCLPPGFVFAEVSPSGSVRCGSSAQTPAPLPYSTEAANLTSALPWASRSWQPNNGVGIWWWDTNFGGTLISTGADWRELLDQILIGTLPSDECNAFKASLNGVLAASHGLDKEGTRESVVNACWQRLHARAQGDGRYSRFLSHPDFVEFLSARIEAFFTPKKRRSKKLDRES